jgi:hypothetical protein
MNFGVGPPPESVAVGDFNGDGRPDLAAANFGVGTAAVLLNTTPAAPSPSQSDATSSGVNEGTGAATITVNRAGGTTGGATVQVATSEGTATAGAVPSGEHRIRHAHRDVVHRRHPRVRQEVSVQALHRDKRGELLHGHRRPVQG